MKKRNPFCPKIETACCPSPTAPLGKSGPSMKSKPVKETPPPEEWDFCEKRLFDEDLLPCLLHEYAREKITRSRDLTRLFTRYSTGKKFDFALYCRLVESLSGPHGKPEITPSLLSEPWKKCDKITKQTEKSRIPVRLSDGLSLKEAVKSDCVPTHPLFCQSGESSPFADFLVSNAAIFKTLTGDADGLEFGYYAIDWNYPDKAIKDALGSWVDAQSRKKQSGVVGKVSNRKAKASRRGLVLKSDRARSLLKALGAVRLRRVKSITKAMTVNQSNKRPIYGNAKEWSCAEQLVKDGLLRLFPDNVSGI